MESSLRHRGDMHLPLARAVGLLQPMAEHAVAPGPEGEVLLRSHRRAGPHRSYDGPLDVNRTAGLIVGLRAAEALYPDSPERDALTSPVPPGPLAREVAVVADLALRGPISPRRLADALSTRLNDPEHPTFELLQPYRESGDWRRARSQGARCEPVLRALPLAVAVRDRRSALLQEVVGCTVPTHRDIRTISAAAAATLAARRLLRQPDPGSSCAFLEEVAAGARSVERVLVRRASDLIGADWRATQHALSNAIYRISELEGNPATETMAQLVRAASTPDAADASGPVHRTALVVVPMAIYLSVHRGSSWEDAITASLELEGASSELSSLTGALSGIRTGLEAIPERFRNRVAGNEHALIQARALARDPLAIRETRL